MKLSMVPLLVSTLALYMAQALPPPKAPKRLSFLAKEQQQAKSQTMAKLYPFYHSTQDIHNELQRLSTSCQGMSLQSVDAEGRAIDVVTVKAPDANPVNKNFLLFGEHSRELISPESGLHFLKSLCGETDLSDRAREVLKDNEFQIVVNGNPGSREKVEQGDFCLRVNPDGVDLNRNWDEQWQAGATLDPADTNPGPKPFSEPETRVFRDLVQAYNPTTFLTVHSGTKGMYMPWAYDMEHLAQRNQPQMMEILKTLDKDHCQCPFGAAGKEVGYSCPGTCLDWVYDKLQTAYAFAFEIYTGPEFATFLRQRWEEKMRDGMGAFYQTNSHLAHEHFRDLFDKHPSCFVQTRAEQHREERSPEECFGQFNPQDESEFGSVTDNWSAAYLDMAAMVAAKLKGGGPVTASPAVTVLANASSPVADPAASSLDAAEDATAAAAAAAKATAGAGKKHRHASLFADSFDVETDVTPQADGTSASQAMQDILFRGN